jgi:hypothetical protein
MSTLSARGRPSSLETDLAEFLAKILQEHWQEPKIQIK